MKRYRVLLILLILTVFTVSVLSVSAQDIDIDSMSNEQLMVLLQSIMQKLDQTEETDETDELTPAPVSAPESTPQPELNEDTLGPESPAGTMMPVSEPKAEPDISIWKNKKLTVEALPGYMFVQPTKEVKPDNNPIPHDGEICGFDQWGFPCHWYLKLDGSYKCECGNG